MHKILSETRLTLSQLARAQGVNTATTWRWALKGVRGVKLESLAIGGRRITSQEAFERFIASTNPQATATPPAQTPHQRRKSIADAERVLAKAGI
jgi:hypothetical protein